MVVERWMPVVGYETHYDVSDAGRVRRTYACRGATAGRVLSQHDRGGYLSVHLRKNDVERKCAVHVIVAEAFFGRRQPGMVPNHKNFNKHDNRTENLEWVTALENARHAARAGRLGGASLPGERNGRAKLTAMQVSLIRRLKGVVGQRALATLCGVSKSAIQFIHQGKHWPGGATAWPREFPEVRNGER